MTSTKKASDIDSYIKSHPKEVQIILEKIRQTIKKTVPQAVETISYQIPAFKLNGKSLVYFAGWKNHVSLYPIPPGNEAFEKEIAPYVAGRGTLKFLLTKPVPYALVQKVTTMAEKRVLGNKK